MALVLANNASTTLASGVTNSATSISVASASGFPSISGSQFFYVTLDDATNIEIVKVTGVSGTTFTIVRGQDDTSGTAFSTGAIVAIRITKLILKDNVIATLGALAGQTIADSGDLTIDVAGDIILDADGDNIFYKAGSSTFYSISNVSGDTYLGIEQSDKDLVIRGNDGGSIITALTLDMSDAGKATFNDAVVASGISQFADVNIPDNNAVRFGNSQDLQIYHDGSNSYIAEGGTGDLLIRSNGTGIRLQKNDGENMIKALPDGAVQLYYDNQDKLETTSNGVSVTGTVAGDVVSAHTTENTVASDDVIAFYDTSASAIRKTAVSNLPGGSGSSAADDITTGDAAVTIGTSSGNITLDTPSDIHLDVGGQIKLDLNGTLYGNIFNTSNNLGIHVAQQDKDLIISGNDNGNSINALTIDMSSSGDAIFNNDVNAAGSVIAQTKLAVGVTAVHASYGFYNQNNAYFNGGVTIDDNLSITAGSISITGDGSNATTLTESGSGDFTIDTVGDIIFDADGGDITFKDAGTSIGKVAINNSGFFDIVSEVSDNDIRLRGNDGGSTITALTLDMSEAGAATFNNNVTAFSDERLKDNIETLEDGLDKVEQLRGVTYTRDGKENIGVIAQEVEKILPEIVLTADDEMGTKSVDYSRITAVLIEAVKELSARVKELESK